MNLRQAIAWLHHHKITAQPTSVDSDGYQTWTFLRPLGDEQDDREETDGVHVREMEVIYVAPLAPGENDSVEPSSKLLRAVIALRKSMVQDIMEVP